MHAEMQVVICVRYYHPIIIKLEYIRTFEQNSSVSNVTAIPWAVLELLKEDNQAIRNGEVNRCFLRLIVANASERRYSPINIFLISFEFNGTWTCLIMCLEHNKICMFVVLLLRTSRSLAVINYFKTKHKCESVGYYLYAWSQLPGLLFALWLWAKTSSAVARMV